MWPVQTHSLLFVNRGKYSSLQRTNLTSVKIWTESVPWGKRKGEINNNTIIVGDFNTPLTPIDRSTKQKINKETQTLNDTMDQLNLIDIYRTFHPKTINFTFFSSAHRTFSRRGKKYCYFNWKKNEYFNKYTRITLFYSGTICNFVPYFLNLLYMCYHVLII